MPVFGPLVFIPSSRSKHDNFPVSLRREKWKNGGIDGRQSTVQGDRPVGNFFPSDGVGVEVARRICADCPVRQPCRTRLANRIDHGVWGGCSERQRRRILKRRRISVN